MHLLACTIRVNVREHTAIQLRARARSLARPPALAPSRGGAAREVRRRPPLRGGCVRAAPVWGCVDYVVTLAACARWLHAARLQHVVHGRKRTLSRLRSERK